MKNTIPLQNVILTLVFIAIFSSCKTELNVNAPYKETPIVYGLLNQNDSIHYIKINKAFLGEADAYQMAQVRDSSEYGDILDVKVNEILNGKVLKTFSLERSFLKNKQTGLFYSPDHIAYSFNTYNQPLNPQAKYELKVLNNSTGITTSAETELVQSFKITKPFSANQATISFATATGVDSDLSIEWFSAVNGRRYTVQVVFNYFEVDKTSLDTIARQLDWSYTLKSKTAKGGELMPFKMTGAEFFNKIANNIPETNGNIERLVHTIDFNFSVAGDELNTYMEVNEPVSGIVQEKPEYTNVVNGIGIFSSRLNQSIKNKGLNSTTVKAIKEREKTFGKGFSKYWDVEKNQYLCITFNSVTASCE
ncbi:MAG: DUF4249 family protein [Bacteroidetes bacterium]|nr:DUF4249 family protein [Bacteroidota bacterium]HET6243084.1 hypothetical protein [Bacteroidia bacterium]